MLVCFVSQGRGSGFQHISTESLFQGFSHEIQDT